MNCINLSIWNPKTGIFIPASKNIRPLFPLKVMAAYLMISFGANVYALPAGGTVASGSAGISGGANSTTITQLTQNAVLNWQSFNIGQNEIVHFLQPNSSSIALNRVIGPDPSSILGSLSANGKVFLVNPNGILFGKSAQVNVGGLVASTLNITDADFISGHYRFAGSGNGAVLNQGSINTNMDGSYVALLGANVGNDGYISARLGTIVLAAGNTVTLDLAGDGLLNVAVNQGAVNALVQNSGLIQADGGFVLLTAQAAGNLLSTVVNNTGHIQAQTIQNIHGTIKMLGDLQNGIVNVGGTLDASAPNGGNGGFIETSAAHVKIANNARITTSAPSGLTGTWLIDPLDFTIAATGDISGAALSALLVTNSIIINTLAGTNSATSLYASANGNGDIFLNEAVSWTASSTPTTLTLNAERDVNINAAVTATKGNLVSTAGRNVNINAAITTTNGGITANAGNNVTVAAAITTTTGNVLLRADNDGNGVGTVIFTAPGAVTLNTGNAYIYYNPISYLAPTNYSGYFSGNGIMNSYMWVFVQGDNKIYNGSNAATLSFIGTPSVGGNVTLNDPGAGATFADKNAANGKTISYSGFTLAGANANLFALFSGSGTTTANIAPKALTISGITASNKIYDGLNSATIITSGASYNGLVSGDALTVNATGTFANNNIGVGKIVTLTSLYSGADVGNYTITSQANTTANILNVPLSIAVPPPSTPTPPQTIPIAPLTIKPFTQLTTLLIAQTIPTISNATAIDYELNWMPLTIMAGILTEQNYGLPRPEKFMVSRFQLWHGAYLTKADSKPESVPAIKPLPVAKVVIALAAQESPPAQEEPPPVKLSVVGNPLDGGKFAKIKIGMSIKQVEELIGAPDWTWQQFTGATSTPYYTGKDRQLVQYTYKSEGMLTFSAGQERLIRMLVNRAG